jgi:hypothetical protein
LSEPSDLLRLPPGFDSSDPVEGNPFPEGDVRHGFWDRATKEAEEEACRLNDDFMRRGRPTTLQEIVPWDIALFTARYDIWARRGVRVVLAREMVVPWDQWLANYANETLRVFKAFSPPDVALEKFRETLIGRREHWKAEGRRNVGLQEAHQARLAASKFPPKSQGHGGDDLTGAEIERLLRSGQPYARRRQAALAALELASATRLIAQSELWKEAANAVQETWPHDRDDLEHVLWPPFSKYSETVFDKIAKTRIELLVPRFSVRRYIHWLRCTCIRAVVDEDVCTPGGQLYATTEHILGVIGEARSPKQIDETRRALSLMLTEFVGGPCTENLRKRLRAHLDGRIGRWEGEAIERSSLSPSESKPVVIPITAKAVEIAMPGPSDAPALKPAETPSAQPQPAATPNSKGVGRKRGPKRDYETAARVAEVVARVAPDGDWRAKLDDVLMALDDAKMIPTPKTWAQKHGYRDWYAAAADATARGHHLAIEAIKHHLKRAKEKPTETIP